MSAATKGGLSGARRDEDAHLRDLDAQARDAAASALDEMATEREDRRDARAPLRAQRLHEGERNGTNLSESAGQGRRRAAEDRAQAALDRRRAAFDREAAAKDRALAKAERQVLAEALDVAHLDDLTGLYRRAAGLTALQHEIDRTRREKGSLVLGFVDIDGLKGVNDGAGHAAGDALIVSVANAMRSHMRSYEPIVRFGGDEFLCALSNVSAADAEARFGEIRAAIGADSGGTIGLGLATLRVKDDLGRLIERADGALIASRTVLP